MIALNLLGPFTFGYFPNFIDLIFFGSGSIVFIFILSWFYGKIPEGNTSTDKLKIPIYQSSDILLQSKSNDDDVNINLWGAKKSTSTLVRIVVFILVIYILFNPFNQFLNFDYFY